MSKINPVSAGWAARCLDAVAGFHTGLSGFSGKSDPGWSLIVTIPPYFSPNSEFSKTWKGNVQQAFLKFSKSNSKWSGSRVSANRRKDQIHITGVGGFKDFENALISLYDLPEMNELMSGRAEDYKEALRSKAPALNSAFNIGKCLETNLGGADKIQKLIEKTKSVKECGVLLEELQKAGAADPCVLAALLRKHEGALVAIGADAAGIKNIIAECEAYRNDIRKQEELFTARAFVPFQAPYSAFCFKDALQEYAEYDDPAKFWSMFTRNVMSNEFDKSLAQMKMSGVLNTKAFPVFGKKLNISVPVVKAQGRGSVTADIGWTQWRFDYPMTDELVRSLKDKYKDKCKVDDTRSLSKAAIPDVFGFETTHSQKITITDPNVTKNDIEECINILYFGSEKNVSPEIQQFAAGVMERSDVIKKAMDSAREAQSNREMIIENRIVPYAAKSAIYIQSEDANKTKMLEDAIKTVLKDAKFSNWSIGPVQNTGGYVSIHLNAPRTGEAAGLCERYMLADELSKALDGKYAVRYPNGKGVFKIEVSERRINPLDRNDTTTGIYIKIPNAFMPGGALDEKHYDDPDWFDGLNEVTKSFSDFAGMFDRSSRGGIRGFVPLTSPNEVYTTTLQYKFKDGEDHEVKKNELKGKIETAVSSLFTDKNIPVTLDWMPDREARKMEDMSRQISAFTYTWVNSWANSQTREFEQGENSPEL